VKTARLLVFALLLALVLAVVLASTGRGDPALHPRPTSGRFPPYPPAARPGS
jgi:hypothetical protein